MGDRLSDLPDELLCRIISLLPITDTFRTSFLSTRWKNLFTLIPSLNIDDTNETRKSNSYSFMNFVDRVLFARKPDVDEFRLKCRPQFVEALRAEGWIHYAVWHNVRELDLDLGVPMQLFLLLPAGLFTCKTLVTFKLKMEQSFLLKIPCKVCLPSLKSLFLELIEFSDDNSVQRLFSSCPVLEELVIQSCELKNIRKFNVSSSTLKRLTISNDPGVYEYEHEVVINAPNLVYFKYYHFIAKDHLLVNLYSLVEAYIDFGPLLNSAFYDSGKTDLIIGISHVQSLHLSGPFSEALLFGHGPIPLLENMTYLKIGQPYPEGWERVLDFAPLLETLVFEELPCFRENVIKPSNEVPLCLSSRIKAIRFLLFGGEKSEMKMAKYFLQHAEVLEKMIIRVIARKNRKLKINNELLKSPIASKKCQVVFV